MKAAKRKLGKSLQIIGGILGIISVLISLIGGIIGSWWQFRIKLGESLTEIYDLELYFNVFGIGNFSEGTAVNLGLLGILAGCLFLISTILILISCIKEFEKSSAICSVLMLGAIILFLFALFIWDISEAFIYENTARSTNEGYNLYFESFFDYFFYNPDHYYSWRLGNGFFLGLIGTIFTLFGSRKIYKVQKEAVKISNAEKSYNIHMENSKSNKDRANDLKNKGEIENAIRSWEKTIEEMKLAISQARIFNESLIPDIQSEINEFQSKINMSEIYLALLEFSKNYPSVLLSEVVEKVNLEKREVKKIILQLIRENLITANYDDKTDRIDFEVIIDEIDRLMGKFDEWEQEGWGKKL